MNISKEELVKEIEIARKKLNESIDGGEVYESVYRRSIELDQLIELYIVSGF